MTLRQLAFNFNIPMMRHTEARQRTSWRVNALAQRHHLPIALASIIATEMGLHVGEVR